MPPKKQRQTTFRGKTPRGIFQTIDVGAGKGGSIIARKKKHPERQYVAVDSQYKEENPYSTKQWRDYTEPYVEAYKTLKEKGIYRFAGNILYFIEQMKKNHQKTRHITIEMPFPYSPLSEYEHKNAEYGEIRTFKKLLEEAPNILLPNGKIFVISEIPETIEEMKKIAQELGYKVRWLKPITQVRQIKNSETMKRMTHKLPYQRLEITFGLKKAIPSKNERRKIVQPKKKK